MEYAHTPRDKSQWKGDHGWIGECGRDVIAVDELLRYPQVDVEVRKAGLLREEVICLRLYTGTSSAPPFLLPCPQMFVCPLCICIQCVHCILCLLHALSTEPAEYAPNLPTVSDEVPY